MKTFLFYSYDPITRNFFIDEVLYVNITREAQISDMILGLRSILLAPLRTNLYFV